MVVLGFVASYSARTSVTSIATRFLRFKAESIVDYLNGQWQLLVRNDLTDDETYVEAMSTAVESYARNTIRQTTELIFATNDEGEQVFATSEIDIGGSERNRLVEIVANGAEGWQPVRVAGMDRIAYVRRFAPLGWDIFVTEERVSFYRETELIIVQTAAILAVSLSIALVLLIIFTRYLTQPLKDMVATMTDVIQNQNLSGRVDILYKDETGMLGHTFNIMLSELERAYDKIKGYALRAAISNMNERKVRNIFQKYVPKDVIDRIFENPESMLVGENRVLAVLFSDIRDFTSISERMSPENIVESLNHYFSIMVDMIVQRQGIVDKYIGDAIMAFFGAPVSRDDDAFQSVSAGLDMMDGLDIFNDWQRKRDRPEFRMGIGINYGSVTIGNIGSEKKMDYTVVGDMVNLANRLESLTKVYGERVIVSESVHRSLGDQLPCRLLDRVVVKGRSIAGGIYGVRRDLTEREEEAWGTHNEAMKLYYIREFGEAQELFEKVQTLLPGDKGSRILASRCEKLQATPPAKAWSGVIEMETK
jgi:class 3 adenylate cyclase/HAMP domain-containing protein